MDLVQIKIEKDNNIVSYIKLIREFDKNISMGDIKKNIENNDFVYEFDLDGREWMYIEGMTEYIWHSNFYQLLKKLQEAGALIEVYLNGTIEDMQLLGNWINTINEISIDCEKHPD